jgi:raffinose/stachyose/melibiose transport system permease protein
MNSAVITVFAVAINLLSGAFASVVIARNNTKAANTLYYYFLFGLTATMQMVTTFFLLRLIKLYGTYAGIILVFAAVNIPYTVMSTSGFIKNVPRELDDAALIDGCGPVTLVIRILLPIMKPIMITNLIITTISVWNNFTIPLYFFNGKLTIPLTVYSFFGRYARNWHYVFAAMTVTILPVIILYLCLQKYIVEGMTSGAVKG